MPLADSLQLVGTTLADKYAIDAVVGEGGFAVVYRATHLLWRRPVAVKVFKALGDVPPERRDALLAEFIREGALLAELSERSAAIVQARDVGMLRAPNGDQVPYMVLEWLEGASLEHVLDDERRRGLRPRTVAQALALLEPAAEALAVAHAKGIAHRDVKPANVFVLGDPRDAAATVKLLDFGIAKVVQDAQKMGGAFLMTGGHVTSFTPAYGAPEQFSRAHGATGPWTDVFALALVLVEVLTHAEPLDGDDFMQLAYASSDPASRPTPRARGAPADEVDDAVEAVFARALAVRPTERFQTAGELWDALRAALHMPPLRASARDSALAPPHASASAAPRDARPFTPRDRTPRDGTIASAPTALASSSPPPPHGSAAAAPHGASSSVTPRARDDLAVAATLAASEATASGATPLATASPAPSTAAAARRRAPRVAITVVAASAVAVAVAAITLTRARVRHDDARAAAKAASAAKTAAVDVVPAAASPACPAGMIAIPGGEFYMGSDDGLDVEKPAHHVRLSPFCIDRLEVTVEAYKGCSDRGACKRASQVNEWDGIRDADRAIYDPLCNARDPEARARHPVNCVDWEMADNYCRVQGSRLPTEAEWELAARGPDGRTFPWGDEPPSADRLNACGAECVAWGKRYGLALHAMYAADDGFPATAPVGSFPRGRSRYGVEDVVGNVWEWVADWFAPYPQPPRGAGGASPKAMTPDPAVADPTGPATGHERVIRGGAWNGAEPSWVRPTFRYREPPGKRSYGIGFRCARTL